MAQQADYRQAPVFSILSELIIHDLLQNVFKPLPPREVVACVASAVGSALMLNVLLAAAVVSTGL